MVSKLLFQSSFTALQQRHVRFICKCTPASRLWYPSEMKRSRWFRVKLCEFKAATVTGRCQLKNRASPILGSIVVPLTKTCKGLKGRYSDDYMSTIYEESWWWKWSSRRIPWSYVIRKSVPIYFSRVDFSMSRLSINIYKSLTVQLQNVILDIG